MADVCAYCKKPINEYESAIEKPKFKKDGSKTVIEMHVKCARERQAQEARLKTPYGWRT